MLFLGIDPGKNGGIAALAQDGTVHAVIKMPETPRDLWRVISTITMDDVCEATMERVWSSPQMGVVSAFTFGRGVGLLHMALAAALVPMTEVTPQTWQKHLSCRTGGDKNISKSRAQALFPTVTVTHSIADALLIAEYGRRVYQATLASAQPGGSHGEEKDTRKEEARTETPGRQEKGRTRPQAASPAAAPARRHAQSARAR